MERPSSTNQRFADSHRSIESANFQDYGGDWNEDDQDHFAPNYNLGSGHNENEGEHICLIRYDERNIFTHDQLVKQIVKSLKSVTEILGVTISAASHLLRQFKWNQEQLQERYFENPEKILSTVPQLDAQEQKYRASQTNTCSICQCTYDPSDMFALECAHGFCRHCWMDYIEVQINNGKADAIQCMQHKCPEMVVDPDWLKQIISGAVLKKFQVFWVNLFVEANPLWKRCPRGGCEFIVQTDGTKASVRCKCGYLTCPRCPGEAHEPASCKEIKEWETQTVKDLQETYDWLKLNTQDCPNCEWPIQKNEGCNHMTCMKCRTGFCWICREITDNHGHCQNQPPKYMGPDSELKRANIDKFSSFFHNFKVHNKSDQLERELRVRIQQQTALMNEAAVSMRLVQIIEEAMENLLECRRILKFTYVHGYFLQGHEEKGFFEFLQKECEQCTEQLSEALNQEPGTMIVEDIRQRSNMAAKRLMNLVEQVQLGLLKNAPPIPKSGVNLEVVSSSQVHPKYDDQGWVMIDEQEKKENGIKMERKQEKTKCCVLF